MPQPPCPRPAIPWPSRSPATAPSPRRRKGRARPARGPLGRAPPVLAHRCQDLLAASDQPPEAEAPAWLDSFRPDMRELLLAELDIRLQPAEGLLAALAPPPQVPMQRILPELA